MWLAGDASGYIQNTRNAAVRFEYGPKIACVLTEQFCISEKKRQSIMQTVKRREWIFSAILILFIVQVVLLPVMIGLTYATRSEQPEHILTYTTGSLIWDKDTAVRPDGSASLSFFETLYENVNAENAEKVLAPGTEKDSIVRLKNNAKREVRYTAILYSLSTDAELSIGASLSGNGFSDITDYTLPEEINRDTVLRAVSGTLAANAMQDFDINWYWAFEQDIDTDASDRIDTYLGDKAADANADKATLGFYLTVYDGGVVVPAPQTGDKAAFGAYVVLLLISGGMTLLFGVTGKRRRRDEA